MAIKILIIVLFLLIIYNLFKAFLHLFKDQKSSKKTVKSLSYRIGITILLFIILILSLYFNQPVLHKL